MVYRFGVNPRHEKTKQSSKKKTWV